MPYGVPREYEVEPEDECDPGHDRAEAREHEPTDWLFEPFNGTPVHVDDIPF
jgi:hypothetical protein